jgi:D-alanyl-D-alanine carboxypeptidase
MDIRHKEWFAPENLEEQIEQYQQTTDPARASTRMLYDLQHIAQSDAQRLAQIRARLVEHVMHNLTREPVPLQSYRQTDIPPFRSVPQHTKKQSTFLVKLISGIAAVFVIAGMLLVFMLFMAHAQQEHRNVGMPVVKSAQTAIAPLIVSPIIKGKAAFLLDTTTGKVLVNVNGHMQVPVASLALIMTAVVAIDNADLNHYVTVKQATLNEVPPGASGAGLRVGDQIQLRELLYGLLLPSGADAAFVIADAVGGNTQNFVAMMNNEAQQLQLNDTHFSSPYGSSASNEYSSAADLTYLVQYAMQLSDFTSVVAAYGHNLALTYLNHSSTLLPTSTLHVVYPGLHTIEGGYDARAGACIVFFVQRNNHLLIGTEMGAQSENMLTTDMHIIL